MGDNSIEILRNFIEYAELDETEKKAIETLIDRTQAMERNIDIMCYQEDSMKVIINKMAQEIYLMAREMYEDNSPYKSAE